MQEKKKKQRDISIELLRIYACIMVIFAHIQISYVVEGEINGTTLFIKCLIGDNVPIFLLILGFFMFAKTQGPDRIEKIPGVYLSKCRSFLVRLYIPTVIVTLIACFAGEFFYHRKSFAELFTNIDMNWDYLKNYVLLQQPTDMVGQFWYIVVYIKLLVFFPLLAFLCVDNKQYNRLRRVYMALSFANLLFNDIGWLTGHTWLNIKDYVFDCHFLYVLLGYELALFLRKSTWKKSRLILTGLGVFALGIVLRYGLTAYAFGLYGEGACDWFMGLECTPSYISSAGCLMLFYALFCGMHSRIVEFLGVITFYIFMVHGMMLRWFAETGSYIRSATGNGAGGWEAVLYYLWYGAVIFVSSFVFGTVLKLAYDGICKGIRYLLEKRDGRMKSV